MTVGPNGWLVVPIARGAADEETATLVFELRHTDRPPLVIARPAVATAWGPDGLLAAFAFDETVSILNPVGPVVRDLLVPPGVSPVAAWAADGRGLLATRIDDDPPVPGLLDLEGRFRVGSAEVFRITGLERAFGARGGQLVMSSTTGPGGSESGLIERRADLAPPCSCVAWMTTRQPGQDPSFGPGYWDAAGDGVWLVVSAADGPRSWLSHLTEPGKDAPVVDLPPGGWRIVGISRADRYVVLEGPAGVILVEADTGRIRQLAVPAEGATPVFVGWAR